MNIDIPKLDASKIIETKSILEYGDPEDSVFVEELKQHGYSSEIIKELNYEDYNILANSWLMTKEHKEIAVKLYPELSDKDITEWTPIQLTQLV